MASLVCQGCGDGVRFDEPIPRDAECPRCRRDLRCCRNCRHYDASFNNACTETQAEPVVDKERRNFCEYFYFSRAAFRADAGDARAAEARARLGVLFGGPPASAGPRPGGASPPLDRAAEARRKLEGLFRAPSTPGDPGDGGEDPDPSR